MDTTGAQTVLRCHDIAKIMARRRVLDNVTLELHCGEIYGLCGPNGAGKTTLLKIISGLVHPTSGRVTFEEGEVAGAPGRAQLAIGIVPESPALVPEVSGAANLRLLGSIRGRVDSQDVAAVLRRVGLDPADRRRVGTYSLGMRARLGLAQALLESPRLLLLDEPTNGLDPLGAPGCPRGQHRSRAAPWPFPRGCFPSACRRRKAMIRLCRFEMTRLLLRRRWLLVVPVSALIAYVSAYSLVAPASIGASLNIWDGLLAAFNSQIFFAVFVPLYVFLVGDCLLADWSTCYSWTVLARVSSRSQWWRAKVVTIMTAALIYVLVAMLTALAVSSLRHLPFATRFSSYALGQGLPRLYQVVWPQAPGAFLLVLWVFTALGLGAFALLAIGVSMWWPRPFVPLGFAVGVIVLSHGLVVRYHSVIPWTIVWRLMYGGALPARLGQGRETVAHHVAHRLRDHHSPDAACRWPPAVQDGSLICS